jgi:diguanylate cyclase (GGDEF)-like protein
MPIKPVKPKSGKRAKTRAAARPGGIGSRPSQPPAVQQSADIVRLALTHPDLSNIEQVARTTNRAINRYLKITRREQNLLRRHEKHLSEGARKFAEVFYDYLFEHPATAQVLHNYKQQGGKIEKLIRMQTGHLHDLLKADTGETNAVRMAHIGEAHYRHQIAPVWIMGAYRLYHDHLTTLIQESDGIPRRDRGPLEDAVTKLLFRDMGLMLEGYWMSANRQIAEEHRQVTELQSQITNLLANLPQLIWSVDVVNNAPLFVSPVTRAICDMDVELPIPCLGWTVPEERRLVEQAWQQALNGDKAEVETRVQEPGGPARWFRRVFYPYRNDRGRVVRIDGFMEDISESRTLTERLATLATTDSLTGLPNRTLFHDRLNQAIATAQRDMDRHVVLMLMDLDHFKEINDTLGHQAGDVVLIEVARRLEGVLREGDTLTRLGGDEFAVLLPNTRDSRRTSEKVAQNLLRALATPFRYGENELFLSASIGIVSFPEHGEDLHTLLSHADVAMYACKNREARYSYYDPEQDPNAPQRLQLSGDLRHALNRRELELHFQPRIDIRKQQLVGAEALIRWRHPDRGLLPPDQFIPLAERSGVINPVTDWVVDKALAQCRAWRQLGLDLRISVNLSGRVFQDPGFTGRVQALLKTHGLASHCLEMEVTENILMTDIGHTATILRSLSDLGILISIDDFGTGYSSLAYLKQLPLNTLKIDKTFVLDMVKDENDALIVRAIIDLAHHLGREVVAEGIETQEAWNLLEILGCDGAQGYHIARPMPASEFLAWARKTDWTAFN